MVCRRIDRQNGVISMPLISGKLRMMQRHPAYQCSSTFTKRSMFPPDDLLRDELGENEISKIHEIEMLPKEIPACVTEAMKKTCNRIIERERIERDWKEVWAKRECPHLQNGLEVDKKE